MHLYVREALSSRCPLLLEELDRETFQNFKTVYKYSLLEAFLKLFCSGSSFKQQMDHNDVYKGFAST